MGYKIEVDASSKLNIIDSNTDKKIKDVSLAEIFDNFIREFDLSGRFTDFSDLNKKINNGDCIKDGTTDQPLLNSLFDNFSLAELKNLAHDVIDKAVKKGYAVRQEFTREKKGDDSIKQRYIGVDFDIGYDAGLGPENFLTSQQFEIFTNFGKHVDPFIILPTKVFPSQGNNIEITENTFKQIGYDNCKVNATATTLYKFTYNILLSGTLLEQDNGTIKDEDKNIQTYFIGNSQKNTFIKNASKKKDDIDKKKAMIVGKSWGDKLQTFIMWIKKHLTDDTSNRITVMCTGDEIVMLFSIILGLPCFYTDIGLNKAKQKINRVLYFNRSQMDPVNATKRFNTEKIIILKGYTDFIELIRTCNETTDIYIKELGDRRFNFEKSFYDAIIADLDVIIEYIEKIEVNSSYEVPDINKKIDDLKKNKINDFLKKGNDELIYMIRSKAKYNENSGNNYKHYLAEAAVTRMNQSKIRSATFHFIATTYFNVNMRGGGALVKKWNMYANMKLIFDMDPKYVYQEDKPRFDANLSLFEELHELYNQHMDHTDFHFISLYSESLHRLSIKPDYTTNNLTKLVTEIFNEFRSFENANAKLIKTSVAKMMNTPESPHGIADVDIHISPKDKTGTVFTGTVFNIPKYKGTKRKKSESTSNEDINNEDINNVTKRKKSEYTYNKTRSRPKDKTGTVFTGTVFDIPKYNGTKRKRSESTSNKTRSRPKDKK